VIVGEFHFGALDRGLFHPGLQKTANQQERAAMYKSYVQGALRNPAIVGTHWFQYGGPGHDRTRRRRELPDRFPGHLRYPYAETIAACREVGYAMYAYRAEKAGTMGD